MKRVTTAGMTYEEKLVFYATAKRATVGTIHQLVDRDFKRYFVGKLRGKIVSRIGDGQFKFDNPADAIDCAKGFRDNSRQLARTLNLSF